MAFYNIYLFLLFLINMVPKIKSSPDSCVKCYTMFLPFLLIKIKLNCNIKCIKNFKNLYRQRITQ